MREYQTVDGVTAKGGSLDGAGPVIVAAMLYVNSGYARFGGAAGAVRVLRNLANSAELERVSLVSQSDFRRRAKGFSSAPG